MSQAPRVIVIADSPGFRDFVTECFGQLCRTVFVRASTSSVRDVLKDSADLLLVEARAFNRLRDLDKQRTGCKLLIVIGQVSEVSADKDFDVLLKSPYDLLLLKDMVLQCVVPYGQDEDPSLRGYLFDLLKRLATALERAYQQQALLDSVLECISSGVVVTDLKGIVLRANPEAKRVLGQMCSQIEGKDLRDIIGVEPAERVLAARQGQFSFRNEIVLNSPQGKGVILGYTTTERKDSSGRTIGRIISFRDLTELKELQHEVEKLNRFSIVAEIASAVAHEIRNPLAGIRAMAQAIDEAMDKEDPKKEYTQRIIRQADRLNDILKSFFNYAKPPQPKMRPVRLQEVIDELEPLITNRLNKKGIRFIKRLQKYLPPVLFDPSQLQQVLLNLILNAIDAVPETGGRIEIFAEQVKDSPEMDDKKIRIDVRDNGEGIPPELQERVFMPFFTTKAWGTGLGLAVVRRIVEENSAELYLTSTPGKGTTFSIYLRRVNETEQTNKGASGRG